MRDFVQDYNSFMDKKSAIKDDKKVIKKTKASSIDKEEMIVGLTSDIEELIERAAEGIEIEEGAPTEESTLLEDLTFIDKVVEEDKSTKKNKKGKKKSKK